MTRDAKTGLGLGLVAALLGGCAPMVGVVMPLVGTAVAGTFYMKSQTVDRTFVAPEAEVKEACRRALEVMALTIKREEARGNEYHIFAAASPQYEVEVTITPITPRATRVSVKADTLPERDKATGLELINQMSVALAPSPLPQLPVSFASGTPQSPTTTRSLQSGVNPKPSSVPNAQMAAAPSSPPSSRLAAPPANGTPQSPTTTRPPQSGVNPKPSWVRLTANAEAAHAPRSPLAKHAETMKLEQIYTVAIDEYIRGDFPAAIAHLRTYIAAQPDSAEKPKALYWLGESLYSQRQYAEALRQFETILRDYPRSPEVPRALFKSAQAYRQVRNSRQAAARLQTLITQHPESQEAQVARTLMAGW